MSSQGKNGVKCALEGCAQGQQSSQGKTETAADLLLGPLLLLLPTEGQPPISLVSVTLPG